MKSNLTPDAMTADLTLRGWVIQEDYLYTRLTDQTVRVCMQSRENKDRYFLTTIPYSTCEEKPPEEAWAGTEDQLRAAHAAICTDDESLVYPEEFNNASSTWLYARVKILGSQAYRAVGS